MTDPVSHDFTMAVSGRWVEELIKRASCEPTAERAHPWALASWALHGTVNVTKTPGSDDFPMAVSCRWFEELIERALDEPEEERTDPRALAFWALHGPANPP